LQEIRIAATIHKENRPGAQMLVEPSLIYMVCKKALIPRSFSQLSAAGLVIHSEFIMDLLRHSRAVSLLSGFLFATTVHAESAKQLPPPSTKQGVTFVADIQPIFQTSCIRCHGADRAKADLRLDTLAAVLKGGKDGAVVIPGDSAKSPLVIAVARVDRDSAMPPIRMHHAGGPQMSSSMPQAQPLTADQVGLIRAWIDQGAK
jgi:hypothetical protein